MVKLAAGAGRQALGRIRLAELELLGLAFRRPDGLGVARDADRGLDVCLSHRWVYRPRSAVPVREPAAVAGLAGPGYPAGDLAWVVHQEER